MTDEPIKKWEYLVMADYDGEDLKIMDENGEEGWELVSAIRQEKIDSNILYFKRPVNSLNQYEK